MSTPYAQSYSMPSAQSTSASNGQHASSMMSYPYKVSFPSPWTGYGCYGPPRCSPPYPMMPWPGYGPGYAPPSCYPQAPAMPPTQAQVPTQSSPVDIPEERFEKIMVKIKTLQKKMEKDEVKRAAKRQVAPQEESTHASSGQKIIPLEPCPRVLTLEPQPVLSLEPRIVLTLEPQPVLVVERRSVSEDSYESPLVVTKQSAPVLPTQKDPTLSPTSLNVSAIKSCIP